MQVTRCLVNPIDILKSERCLKKLIYYLNFLNQIIKNNFNYLTNNCLNRIAKIIRFLPKSENQFLSK